MAWQQHADELEAQAQQPDNASSRVCSLTQVEVSQQLQGEQDSSEEEELIRMDDPLFATLSERRQKLMALEEVLLNTGIEG